MFLAGNRTGKTECAAFELTAHLTGLYPKWWSGRKFNRPARVWASGDTLELIVNPGTQKAVGALTLELSQWGFSFVYQSGRRAHRDRHRRRR
jgi:hypothetical protein